MKYDVVNFKEWIRDIKFKAKAYNYDAYFLIIAMYGVAAYVSIWMLK